MPLTTTSSSIAIPSARTRDAFGAPSRTVPVAVALSAMTFETMPPIGKHPRWASTRFRHAAFPVAGKDRFAHPHHSSWPTFKVRPSGWVQTAHDVTIEIEGSKKRR